MEMTEKNRNNVETLKKNVTKVRPVIGIKISKLFKNPRKYEGINPKVYGIINLGNNFY